MLRDDRDYVKFKYLSIAYCIVDSVTDTRNVFIFYWTKGRLCIPFFETIFFYCVTFIRYWTVSLMSQFASLD